MYLNQLKKIITDQKEELDDIQKRENIIIKKKKKFIIGKILTIEKLILS